MADILIISSNAKDWSKNSGGKERTAVLAEALEGHNVTFLSFNWDGAEKVEQVYNNVTHIEVNIEPHTRKKYLRLIRGLAKSNYDALVYVLRPHLQTFAKKVRELSRRSDLVILDHYATAPFLDEVPDTVPVIYNSHNAEIIMAKQLYPKELEVVSAVEAMERFAIEKAKAITYCSKKDFKELKEYYGVSCPAFYVPNGTSALPVEDILDRRKSNKILFVGSSHPPNVVAAKNLVAVSELMPEYDFVLCGGATSNLVNLAGKNYIAMGFVEEDVLAKLFKESFAFINPMESGSGTHLKVMRALGVGIPIITSEMGARGFSDQEISQSMMIANTTEEMVEAIKTLESKDVYQKMANGSIEVGKQYQWSKIQKDYLKIINDVIDNHPVKNKEVVSNVTVDKPKVLLYSIIRNRNNSISRYYEQIKSFVDALPEYEFYLSIYENDSVDGTKANLLSRDWSFVNGVSIICENIRTPYYGSVRDSNRVRILAEARNKAIEAGGFLDKVDYVLMIEGDVEYDTKSIKSLLRFEDLEPDFDIVSSISLKRGSKTHYDWWATRLGPVSNLYVSEIEEDYQNKDYGRYYSTSNGLCLYRAKPFQEGVRHGWINLETKEFDCEMVVLCQEFQARGYKNIFINYKAKAIHSG